MKASATLAQQVVLIGLACQTSLVTAQDEPLHVLIDRHLTTVPDLSAVCSDAEFLRRVWLDLAGLPPMADQVRAFLADTSADKRERAVDRLLDSPHFERHMTTTLDVMLMERRGNQHVPQDDWHNWLLTSLRAQKPWNVLAREILSADGDDPALRAAARFFLDRQSEPNLLTRDIGRIFFGRDLQCAQCHDHPLIDDYRQADYHGLLAFVAPGYALVRKETVKERDKETTKDVTIHAEKAGGDLTFESVFLQGTLHRTGPRLFDDVAIEEPFFYPGEEYAVAPAEGVKSVPKFSRRAKLAERASDGTNRMFNENMANRLWAHMLGRGLVHPVDLHHYDNPPSDPALLALLSERFAAMNFDIRRYLREIALSEVYQRSFDRPADVLTAAVKADATLRDLEQQYAILQQAAGSSSAAFYDALEAWEQAEGATLPAADALDKARQAFDQARQKHNEAVAARTVAQQELNQKQEALAPVQQAATATQQAVDALKGDTELAAAARKFAERAQQLSGAVAKLQTSVDEKSAAASAAAETFHAAKPPVDEALAKLTPLREALRQAELLLLTARRKMRADAVAIAALDRRLETMRELAALPQHRQAIASARETASLRETDRETARRRLDESVEFVAMREADLSSADDVLAAATSAVSELQAVYDTQREIANAVLAAAESAQTASEKLPDDNVLAEAAGKLQERAAALQSKMSEAQTTLEAAKVAQVSAREARERPQRAVEEARVLQARCHDRVASADDAVAAAEARVIQCQATYNAALSQLTERWTADATISYLKPLTPEQLCWSVLRVTGVYDRYWQAEAAEVDNASPLTDEQQQDPGELAARNRAIDQRTYEKLKGNVGTFVRFYGAAAGQPQGDFFATADQALFAANGGTLNSWVAPSGGNVTARVLNAENPTIASEELYLAVLNRHPTAEETADVTAYLSGREADRSSAAQELIWGLINTMEFRFNH